MENDKIKINVLIDKITTLKIDVPPNLTVNEAMRFIDGYSKCQQDLITMISDIIDPL